MVSVKVLSLIALTALGCFVGVLLQSTTGAGYSPATVVLATELLKGTVAFCISFWTIWQAQEDPSAPSSFGTRTANALRQVRENVFNANSWKVAVPAALYVVGNNLAFVAAANLPLPTFQVAYNLKILTTALFSVVLLKKHIKPQQWLSLCLLMAGIGAVQLAAGKPAPVRASFSASAKNPLVGLLAVLVACCTGAIASVYFEMVLKGTQSDLWTKNMQMSFYSILPALGASALSSKPMFAHFGGMAVLVVVAQTMNGLVTALVIKYADNILKGFTSALAIILAAGVSVALFGFKPDLLFVLGAVTVIGATVLYGSQDTPSPPANYPLLERIPQAAP